MKTMIATLIVTVTLLSFTQTRAQAMLIPSAAVQSIANVNRSADLKTIQTTLESKALRARLHAMGLSDAEIQTRLSRLSDADVHQLASQIRAVNPAGDIVIGVLVAVVLILLILLLIKRIIL